MYEVDFHDFYLELQPILQLQSIAQLQLAAANLQKILYFTAAANLRTVGKAIFAQTVREVFHKRMKLQKQEPFVQLKAS